MKRGVSLDGARILITGASGGIGRALAVALAAKQARLILVAPQRNKLEALAAEIAVTGRPRPEVVAIDLSLPDAPDELTQAEAVLAGVDILINNVGASVVEAQTVVGGDEPGRALFELNYWAPLALTAALVPEMQRTGRGAVVNVTSALEFVPMALVGHYDASKAAFARATDVLRSDLRGSGVRVLEVAPGSLQVRPESEAAAIVQALEQRVLADV